MDTFYLKTFNFGCGKRLTRENLKAYLEKSFRNAGITYHPENTRYDELKDCAMVAWQQMKKDGIVAITSHWLFDIGDEKITEDEKDKRIVDVICIQFVF